MARKIIGTEINYVIDKQSNKEQVIGVCIFFDDDTQLFISKTVIDSMRSSSVPCDCELISYLHHVNKKVSDAVYSIEMGGDGK